MTSEEISAIVTVVMFATNVIGWIVRFGERSENTRQTERTLTDHEEQLTRLAVSAEEKARNIAVMSAELAMAKEARSDAYSEFRRRLDSLEKRRQG